MSGSEKCGCQDEKIKISIEGKVPQTIGFECPGKDCGGGCCKPKKKDNNNNNNDTACMCGEEGGKKKEEECKEEEKAAPPPPEIRRMPKTTDCTACQQQKESTANKCADAPKYIEDNPPPICTQLPETKTFKCIEDDCCADEGKGDKVKKGDKCASPTGCKSCGAPVNGPKCDCGKPLPPVASKPPCGCNKGGACGPNTSCDVQPLSFKKNKK